jgi:hypothetical protein
MSGAHGMQQVAQCCKISKTATTFLLRDLMVQNILRVKEYARNRKR